MRANHVGAPAPTPPCVEHGMWTPLPVPPPAGRLKAYTLRLKDAHRREARRIEAAGAMTFHMVGCTGCFYDHVPQHSVARVMTAQVRDRGTVGCDDPMIQRASFLYHLGDVVYKDEDMRDEERDDQCDMYNTQFYQPYSGYKRRIFAIAGNHDGKQSHEKSTSAIHHFMLNFCSKRSGRTFDNQTDGRCAMRQPYPYWRLSTPQAYILGLYSNIANGGILDNPAAPETQPQYRWLVRQLTALKRRNARREQPRPILLAVHYPPFSGASNFAQRGDPTLGPSHAIHTLPLAAVLRQAFDESGQRPDAVFSAHAHLYQRLMYHFADGWELPYVVAGSGGHAPVESLWEKCGKGRTSRRRPPFDAVRLPGMTLPAGEAVRVVAYNDTSFGFLRITISGNMLLGEFITTDGNGGHVVSLADSFRLDLAAHRLI
ncbi:MAG TPA: metallophosphoesterase [Ktedonobacterales bacterium]|nr:metallophosphoesterase [Ktedonobacterales bacterium]